LHELRRVPGINKVLLGGGDIFRFHIRQKLVGLFAKRLRVIPPVDALQKSGQYMGLSALSFVCHVATLPKTSELEKLKLQILMALSNLHSYRRHCRAVADKE
jgi:hypothetical protein